VTNFLTGVSFTDANAGTAVGSDGAILRTTSGGTTWAEPAAMDAGERSYALSQNFPNPFSQSTTIPYSLSTPAHVTLAVYNSLGQKLALLVDAYKQAGDHTAQWRSAKLKGVFFARLTITQATTQSPPIIETKRMIVIR
jgi:hypothetical protein